MTQPLVLSLFPGIGLLDMAFELEGFCVVRGPDVLWGGDIRNFHPPAGKFDGVIGGPPCQMFSRLAHMVRHNGHEPKFGNLIPEFERCVGEAEPAWFLMEEVPDAPVPAVSEYEVWNCILNNRQLGEAQNRERRFSFGAKNRTVLMIETVALFGITSELCVTGHADAVPVAIGGSGKIKTTKYQREEPPVLASELSKGMPPGTRKRYSGGHNGYVSRSWERICELQGLPEGFDLPPFTVAAKCKAVGNGVPIPMGRAIAKAVKEAIGTLGDKT